MKLKFLVLFVIILLLGCREQDERSLINEDDVILVLVDGRPITLPMLEFLMASRGVTEDDPAAMRELLDELIRIRVMANAAETQGLDTSKAVRAERAIKDMETLYVRFLEHFQTEHPVTDEEIERAYAEQLQRAGDRQYRLRTIAYDRQADALRALARIQDGEADFESTAEQAREAGGRVSRTGWLDRSQVPADFGAELERTGAPGVVGMALPVEGEWLLARVEDTRALQAPELDEVRDGIRRTLIRQRSQALIDDFYEAAEIEPMLPMEAADPGE